MITEVGFLLLDFMILGLSSLAGGLIGITSSALPSVPTSIGTSSWNFLKDALTFNLTGGSVPTFVSLIFLVLALVLAYIIVDLAIKGFAAVGSWLPW